MQLFVKNMKQKDLQKKNQQSNLTNIVKAPREVLFFAIK